MNLNELEKINEEKSILFENCKDGVLRAMRAYQRGIVTISELRKAIEAIEVEQLEGLKRLNEKIDKLL